MDLGFKAWGLKFRFNDSRFCRGRFENEPAIRCQKELSPASSAARAHASRDGKAKTGSTKPASSGPDATNAYTKGALMVGLGC